MKHRIIEATYMDDYGNRNHKVYHVQTKKSFLSFPYWKYETRLECGYGDCYDVRLEFKTYGEALKFIKDNLCGKDFKPGWSYKVMREVDCNPNPTYPDTL
jgi:hypothetical protein